MAGAFQLTGKVNGYDIQYYGTECGRLVYIVAAPNGCQYQVTCNCPNDTVLLFNDPKTYIEQRLPKP